MRGRLSDQSIKIRGRRSSGLNNYQTIRYSIYGGGRHWVNCEALKEKKKKKLEKGTERHR